MTLIEEKKALRRRLISERKAIDGAEKAALDRVLCAHIAEAEVFRKADLVLGFLPIRGEPDLTPLLPLALASGKAVALPRCRDGEMRFLAFTDKTVCVPDQFGILAPPEGSASVHCTENTLCLLPGLAAGRDGTRLGYGGGFYDRFLSTFPGHTLFALYQRFLFPTLPTDSLDHPAEIIITEKGVITPL